MSRSHRYDVLVAGEINVDLILTGSEVRPQFGHERLVQDATLTMGSSSVIFACQAARLGLRVGFVGMAGRDTFGDFMLAGMDERGIDVGPVVRLPGTKTGITVSLSEPRDRAMLTYEGTITALRAGDVPNDLIASARHLHVGSAFLQAGLLPGLPDLFGRARALGVSTSLDTGCDPAERWDGAVHAALRQADVFMPNEVEAPALTGAPTPEVALEVLAERVPVVAVKLGARGALAASGSERTECSPFRMSVVDTTGAGDSFDAGFLYGYLAGWPLERSLRLGCACGALSTRAAGGTASQGTLPEAMALVER
jgi:sugar/nucleoside kinase (ribokinase family)